MISTISPLLSGSWFGFSLLMVCLPLNLGYKDHCISTLAHYFQLCFQRLAYGHDCLVEKGFGFDGQFIKVLKGNRVLQSLIQAFHVQYVSKLIWISKYVNVF